MKVKTGLRKANKKVFDGEAYSRAGQTPTRSKKVLESWADYQRRENNLKVKIIPVAGGYDAYVRRGLKKRATKTKAVVFAVSGDETVSGRPIVHYAADGDLNHGKHRAFSNWSDAVAFAQSEAKAMEAKLTISGPTLKRRLATTTSRKQKFDICNLKLPKLKISRSGQIVVTHGRRHISL